jgi:hemerythrin
MPLFAWKDSYSVNVESLDEHHKKLFDIFNHLYESTLHPGNVDSALPIIDDLLEYSGTHFRAEEIYMQEQNYPEIAEHVSKHVDFTKRIKELHSQYRNNDLDVTMELIVVLGNWLLRHVLEEDRKYSKKAHG